MSYDLVFIPRKPGQSWADALGAAEDSAADDPATRLDEAAWHRLVAGARTVLGEVSVRIAADGREVDHEETGVQLCVSGGGAVITVPYRYTGDAARRIVAAIYRLGRTVERVTGLQGYDPQVELPLRDAVDSPELAEEAFDATATGVGVPGVGPSRGSG